MAAILKGVIFNAGPIRSGDASNYSRIIKGIIDIFNNTWRLVPFDQVRVFYKQCTIG